MIYVHCARYVRRMTALEPAPTGKNGWTLANPGDFLEGIVRVETSSPEPPEPSHYMALIPRLVKAEYLGRLEKETA